MNNDKRNALLDCLSALGDALSALDDADDQDDPAIIAIHWEIKDVMSTIEGELER